MYNIKSDSLVHSENLSISSNKVSIQVKGLHIPQCAASKNQVSVSGVLTLCGATQPIATTLWRAPVLASVPLASHVSLTLSQQVRAQLQKSAYICHSRVASSGGNREGVMSDTAVLINTNCWYWCRRMVYVQVKGATQAANPQCSGPAAQWWKKRDDYF